jgi:elongator complex protein 1
MAFKNAGDWRMAFVCANKLNYAKEELSSLAYDMTETFKTESRFSEAATLFVEYCNDVEQAIVTLIEGHEWQEALRRVSIVF